jgi:nucleotide-binding universal stress UspA family protein
LEIIPIGNEPFGGTLLARAHEVGADMLVMGAYAHSPWRERILGGVTRYLIAHADLPVLMRH